MAENTQEGASPEQAVSSPTPKKRRKWPIVVGVIVVVLVCAGIGMWTWHNQPSFCNSVCHSPMDNYVNSYYDNSSNTLANLHKQKGKTCLDCHESKIDEQMTEAVAWMGGNFKVDTSGNIVGAVSASADSQFCGRCHDMAQVKASTENWGGVQGVNPHESHLDTVQCQNCHSAHGTSNMWCNTCHDWKVPTGWTSGGE